MIRFYVLIGMSVILTGGGATYFHLKDHEVMSFVAVHWDVIAHVFIAVCVVTLINIFIRWVRWHYLTRRLGMRIPARHALSLYVATLPMILTPLTAGEVVRAFWIRKKYDGAWSMMARIWLIERLADVSALLSFVVVYHQNGVSIVAWLIVMSILLGYVLSQKLGYKTLVTIVVTSTLAWLCTAFSLYGVLWALHQSMNIMQTLSTFSLSTLVGGVALMPGGAGVTGSLMVDQLSTMRLPEIEIIVAIIVFRAATVWFAVLIGVLTYIFCRKNIRIVDDEQQQFNELDAYDEQIASHMRNRLLTKKINHMVNILENNGVTEGNGIDIGCGTGHYTKAMMDRGYSMVGVEYSSYQRERCMRINPAVSVKLMQGTLEGIEKNSVDFVYNINVLHHVTNLEERDVLWNEMIRVLKPEGVLLVHEINTDNPVFRFYMGYVFPLLKSIDEGTEKWISPQELPEMQEGKWSEEVYYYTFLPDFLPLWMLRLLQPLERCLEQSRWKHLSAHYGASFVKGKRHA